MAQSINGRRIGRVIIAAIHMPAAILLALVLIPAAWTAASADRIVLKDGSVEITERVWESADYIHFILNGTRNVEIRYARHIVERIERDANRQSPDQDGGADQTIPALAPSDNRINMPAAKTVEPDGAFSGPPRVNLITASKGISFYDPRRPMRYWAHAASKHDRLEQALDAMAAHYQRSAKWVTRHMGDENDLSMIHANLVRQIEAESGGAATVFGPTSAQQNGRAGQRAIQNQSDGHEATEIAPLSRPIATKPTPREVDIAPGIQFYDPRRPQKYWSGRMIRHNTLQEAIAALAVQYGTTPDWIERHMGDTNDLAKIHQSIQQNLPSR